MYHFLQSVGAAFTASLPGMVMHGGQSAAWVMEDSLLIQLQAQCGSMMDLPKQMSKPIRQILGVR